MSYAFFDASNEPNRRALEAAILDKENPFPRNPVCTKDALPKFCYARKEEIGIIKNAIEKVGNEPNHKSAWVAINGEGGTGKSTIALYVYGKAKQNKSRDLNIEHVEANFVECPTDPNSLVVQHLYLKMMEDFGEKPAAFPYELAFKFLLAFGNIILQDESIKTAFQAKFGSLWNEITCIKQFSDFQVLLKRESHGFAAEFKALLNDYDYLVKGNPQVTVPFDYITMLVDLLSTETSVRQAASAVFTGKALRNEDEAREAIKRLITCFNFIFKNECLLLIIDNLENLPDKPEAYLKFTQLLLKFRNEINNCVLLTIGSTDFWQRFNRNINASEMTMLRGFQFEHMTVKNLSDEDASEILQKYITDFWASTGVKPRGGDSLYPFSKDAFKYLYEIKSRNLRECMLELFKIVERYKSNHTISYVRDIFDAIYQFKPASEKVYLFENEIEALEKHLDTCTDRNQLSRDIEIGLTTCFLVLKDSSTGKFIYKVEHEPKCATSYGPDAHPDVYLTLTRDDTLLHVRRVEFQVKAYYPTNTVQLKEIIGSLNLLKDGTTHYIHFLTLSPLHEDIIQALKSFEENVGRLTPLDSEEACHLLLLTNSFTKLFFHVDKLDAAKYVHILEMLNIKIKDLFERLLTIPEATTKIPAVPGPKLAAPKHTELIPARPRIGTEKISNPALLEPIIIKILKEKGLVPKKEDLIALVMPSAKSESVVSNALSALSKANKIHYSRTKPSGWSLV